MFTNFYQYLAKTSMWGNPEKCHQDWKPAWNCCETRSRTVSLVDILSQAFLIHIMENRNWFSSFQLWSNPQFISAISSLTKWGLSWWVTLEAVPNFPVQPSPYDFYDYIMFFGNIVQLQCNHSPKQWTNSLMQIVLLS
jgi:hypothetical protein